MKRIKTALLSIAAVALCGVPAQAAQITGSAGSVPVPISGDTTAGTPNTQVDFGEFTPSLVDFETYFNENVPILFEFTVEAGDTDQRGDLPGTEIGFGAYSSNDTGAAWLSSIYTLIGDVTWAEINQIAPAAGGATYTLSGDMKTLTIDFDVPEDVDYILGNPFDAGAFLVDPLDAFIDIGSLTTGSTFQLQIDNDIVPEPGVLGLLGVGCAGLVLSRRRVAKQ